MIHQALWRSRLATAPETPTCIVIHSGQFTGGVHPQNQFVPEIGSPLPCSQTLVRHILLIVYFFKELISFIGSLDKCHTTVFNALILWGIVIPRYRTKPILSYAWFFNVLDVQHRQTGPRFNVSSERLLVISIGQPGASNPHTL